MNFADLSASTFFFRVRGKTFLCHLGPGAETLTLYVCYGLKRGAIMTCTVQRDNFGFTLLHLL